MIKPGTKNWNKAVDTIRKGGKPNPNFRTASENDAIRLAKEGRGGNIERKGSSTDPYNQNTSGQYKKGYEVHPEESSIPKTKAPDNNLPHVKWKDYEAGKSGGGQGHVFF